MKTGDRVCWIRGSNRELGTIIATVPPNTKPVSVLTADLLKGVSTKLLGPLDKLVPRMTESYIVEISVGGKSVRAIVWPAAEKLESAE